MISGSYKIPIYRDTMEAIPNVVNLFVLDFWIKEDQGYAEKSNKGEMIILLIEAGAETRITPFLFKNSQ